MDDRQIVELYWARDERAIKATSEKYANYCHSIAYGILRDHSDSEECVNDTYLRAWEYFSDDTQNVGIWVLD